MVTSSSLYIIYSIIKNTQDFTKTGSLYESKNYLGKKNYLWEIFFYWKNGCKNEEENVTKYGWDICYRDLQETQKSPQSKEDQ